MDFLPLSLLAKLYFSLRPGLNCRSLESQPSWVLASAAPTASLMFFCHEVLVLLPWLREGRAWAQPPVHCVGSLFHFDFGESKTTLSTCSHVLINRRQFTALSHGTHFLGTHHPLKVVPIGPAGQQSLLAHLYTPMYMYMGPEFSCSCCLVTGPSST